MTSTSLLEQLKHPNPHLRERATIEIAETRDEETISQLMAILDSDDTVYRRAAVKALGMVGFDALPAVIEGMLHSENVTVRGSCTKAMTQIALNFSTEPFPAYGLAALKTAIADPNPVVNIAAVMTLGEIGADAFDILAETVKTTDNVAVQVSIANALAAVGDDRSANLLTELSEDPTIDSYVKESAVSALSRLNGITSFMAAQGQ
jgi:bilin biosynthesis protein